MFYTFFTKKKYYYINNMSAFKNDYVKDLKKMDTIVAYIVAFSIHYTIYKGLISALFFAAIFVILFLFIINIVDAVKIMIKSYTR